MCRNPLLTISAAFVLAILSPSASAEAVGGPKVASTNVRAFAADRFQPIMFYADRIAQVTISGDGDTDLDLYIYDAYGNLVAVDDDGSDYCVANWVPSRTGYYTVVVRNRGRVYNNYTMTTN